MKTRIWEKMKTFTTHTLLPASPSGPLHVASMSSGFLFVTDDCKIRTSFLTASTLLLMLLLLTLLLLLSSLLLLMLLHSMLAGCVWSIFTCIVLAFDSQVPLLFTATAQVANFTLHKMMTLLLADGGDSPGKLVSGMSAWLEATVLYPEDVRSLASWRFPCT